MRIEKVKNQWEISQNFHFNFNFNAYFFGWITVWVTGLTVYESGCGKGSWVWTVRFWCCDINRWMENLCLYFYMWGDSALITHQITFTLIHSVCYVLIDSSFSVGNFFRVHADTNIYEYDMIISIFWKGKFEFKQIIIASHSKSGMIISMIEPCFLREMLMLRKIIYVQSFYNNYVWMGSFNISTLS